VGEGRIIVRNEVDDPYYECDGWAYAKYRSERRDDTTHSDIIRKVHPLTARY